MHKNMKWFCRPQKSVVFAGIITIGIVLLLSLYSSHIDRRLPTSPHRQHVPRSFQVPTDFSNCFHKSMASIGTLVPLLKRWSMLKSKVCSVSYELLTSMYEVKIRKGVLHWDKEFDAKMLRWLGNDTKARHEAHKQEIIFIRNKLTGEGSIFNPLRAKRPGPNKKNMTDLKYVQNMSDESRKKCDFCNYTTNTAYDAFGRIESKHAVTAANAFKLDEFHSLVILRKHEPLDWTYEQLMDAFNVIDTWFHRVQSQNNDYVYPVISWELLPKSGGSQIHPHLHVYINPDGYFGYQQHFYDISVAYSQENRGQNFYTDLVSIHHSLGLSITHGKAVAIANLTPRKDNEVIIIANHFSVDFKQLVYATLRTYIDEMGIYSFSMAIALPLMKGSSVFQPAVARVITRGSVQAITSDITSMEIYTASNIDTDLFKFAGALQMSTAKIISRIRKPSK